MALIVETGAIIAGANSVVSDVEYVAYAVTKGLTIGATADDRKLELLQGMDYIISREHDLQGSRKAQEQTLPYPRINVMLYGWLAPSDSVPVNFKNAQMEAAAFAHTSALLTNTTVTNIKSAQVDVIKTEYFAGGSRSNVSLQRVNAWLSPLMMDFSKTVLS